MAIHWNETKRIRQYVSENRKKVWRNRKHVKVICDECGAKRWWYIPWLKSYLRKKPEFNGRCKACSMRDREWYKGGTWIKQSGPNGGYILLRRNHFTDEELAILEPMWPVRARWYIPQHRAIMALHLGRALEKDEIVHHLNGIRDDNRLENLRLLKRNSHHNAHGDNYYQRWQEAKSEINRLKNLLKKQD